MIRLDFGEMVPGTMATLGDPEAWANNPGGNTAMAVSLLAGAKGGGEAADAGGSGSAVDTSGDAGVSRTGIEPYIAARRLIEAARAQRAAPTDVEAYGGASDPVAVAGPTASPEKAQPAIPYGNHYSVAFTTKLKPTSYPGLSRASHFQEANESLLTTMENDEEMAQMMRNLGVNISRTPTGLAPRTSPPGWTWHHAMEPGVMELVPRDQHTLGSVFWSTLHPGGLGGYSIWGQQK